MYIDKDLELSSSQVVTTSAASTNHIDLGAAGELGHTGKHIAVTVDVSADSATDTATVVVKLQCDSDVGFGSPKTVIQTDAIPQATLVAGYQIFLPLPIGLNERYVRLFYTVGGESLTLGKISAAVVEGVQKSVAYADAL